MQVCPPQLLIFDLKSDTLLRRYVFPKSSLKDNSFLPGLTLDVTGAECGTEQDDSFAYISDIFAFGMIVYSFKDDRSYRVEHEYMMPDPLACKFSAGGIDFKWIDGIFGMALTPLNKSDLTAARTLYFHPMSSFHEFSVSTAVLRNETASKDSGDAFQVRKNIF